MTTKNPSQQARADALKARMADPVWAAEWRKNLKAGVKRMWDGYHAARGTKPRYRRERLPEDVKAVTPPKKKYPPRLPPKWRLIGGRFVDANKFENASGGVPGLKG